MSRSCVNVKVVGEGHGHKIEGQGHTSRSRAQLKVKVIVKGQDHGTEGEGHR